MKTQAFRSSPRLAACVRLAMCLLVVFALGAPRSASAQAPGNGKGKPSAAAKEHTKKPKRGKASKRSAKPKKKGAAKGGPDQGELKESLTPDNDDPAEGDTSEDSKRRLKGKKEKGPSGKKAHADASKGGAVLSEGKDDGKGKTFRFGELEIEGRLKSPQIVYFLRRVRAEFAAGDLGHRSFSKELSQTRHEPAF